jgi:sirohydrochlorin ferrochelatase
LPKISYFLVTHGSRNPSAAEFLYNLVALAQAKFTHSKLAGSESEALVGGGLLEGHELSLNQQLSNFANIAKSQGYDVVLVLPVFLLAGVHICEDLPEQIAITQASSHLESKIEFKIANHFGTYPIIPSLLKSKFPQVSPAKILLAHGSRRPETTQYLENLAQELDAIPAYWSIAPSLETQIEQLIDLGHPKIIILPYFLASGGIIDAIATKISTYSIPIQLLELPFDPQAIATLVMDYAQSLSVK